MTKQIDVDLSRLMGKLSVDQCHNRPRISHLNKENGGLYPFSSNYLDLGGVRYHYLDEGTGPTLLIVHGNPTWSFHWRNLITALRPRFRLVAPDHVGCGLSDKPQDYPYRLAQHIENLAALIEQLDLRDITLVGHDWGGAIGLGAAAATEGAIRPAGAPEYGGISLDGGSLGESGSAARRCWAARCPRTEWLRSRGAVDGRLPPRADDAGCARRVSRDRTIVGPIELQSSGLSTTFPLNPRHPKLSDALEVEHGLPMLAGICRPALFGACAIGASRLSFSTDFWSSSQTAEVHRIADAGHWVMEDACEEVIRIVEQFVEEH